jgi:hypothetical protein
MKNHLLSDKFFTIAIVEVTADEVFNTIKKFTLFEIMTNTGENKDCEFFYALQELHYDELLNGTLLEPTMVRADRDNPLSIGILTQVTREQYRKE